MLVNDFRKERKIKNKTRYQSTISNPYFGFVILAALLILFQILNMIGIEAIGVSLMRALGYTIIYSIVGLGFALLLGYGGLASLGTAGFMGLGAYLTGYLLQNVGVPYILTLAIALIVSVIIGVLVGFISLRVEGMYLAIITLGLSEILVELFKNLDKYTKGVDGLRLRAFPSLFKWDFINIAGFQFTRETIFFVLVAILFVLLIITMNIINSPTGRAMLAMKNSDSAAQSMGISLLKYRLLAFIFATTYAVIGGFLYMSYARFSIPTTWSLGLSLNILAAVVVGGSKSIWGVMAGTFVIFGLDSVVFQNIQFIKQNPGITMFINGILIIVIVMFYPGGLTRLFYDLKANIKKAIKQRKEYIYGKD